MAELTRKRRVRGGHKASATRMMTRAEEMLSSGDEPQRAMLNQLSMSLKEKLGEIKLLDADEMMNWRRRLGELTNTRSVPMPP